MQNITTLLQEAKPLYKTRKRNRRLAAIGSSLSILCFAFMFTLNIFHQSLSPIYDIWGDEIDQVQTGSVIEDIGLPVDEYGLLKVC